MALVGKWGLIMQWILNNKKKLITFIFIIIVFFISYYLFAFGYATYKNTNDNTAIFVNNSYQGNNNKKIKLRVGNYNILLSRPEAVVEQKIFVFPFINKEIDFKPKNRDFKEEIGRVTNNDSSSISNYEGQIVNDSWYGALVTFDKSVQLVVMKFVAGEWQLKYSGDGIDNEYTTAIPQQVQQYLNNLSSKNFND